MKQGAQNTQVGAPSGATSFVRVLLLLLAFAGLAPTAQSQLAELRNTKPVGRLAINLPQVLQAVLGEVQTVTSLLNQPGLSRSDYLGLSGGLTQKADKSRIYVVHANGGGVASSGSKWFRSDDKQMRPGDTIVVPVDTERLPQLQLWTSVTSIMYNLAVAVAAVNSF